MLLICMPCPVHNACAGGCAECMLWPGGNDSYVFVCARYMHTNRVIAGCYYDSFLRLPHDCILLFVGLFVHSSHIYTCDVFEDKPFVCCVGVACDVVSIGVLFFSICLCSKRIISPSSKRHQFPMEVASASYDILIPYMYIWYLN